MQWAGEGAQEQLQKLCERVASSPLLLPLILASLRASTALAKPTALPPLTPGKFLSLNRRLLLSGSTRWCYQPHKVTTQAELSIKTLQDKNHRNIRANVTHTEGFPPKLLKTQCCCHATTAELQPLPTINITRQSPRVTPTDPFQVQNGILSPMKPSTAFLNSSLTLRGQLFQKAVRKLFQYLTRLKY